MLPIGSSTTDRTIHIGAPPGGDGRGRRGARCRHVFVVAVPLLIVRARRIALPECQGGNPPGEPGSALVPGQGRRAERTVKERRLVEQPGKEWRVRALAQAPRERACLRGQAAPCRGHGRAPGNEMLAATLAQPAERAR